MKTIEQRIREKTEKLDSGCWIWTGGKCNGYGSIRITTSPKTSHAEYVHRLMYVRFRGDIPAGLEPDHLCRNRACINPDHLELVPKIVNIMRGNWPSAVNARKTACPRGHPYDAVLVRRSGRRAGRQERYCSVCARSSQR